MGISLNRIYTVTTDGLYWVLRRIGNFSTILRRRTEIAQDVL